MKKNIVMIFMITAMAVMSSCTGNKVYDKYQHTPISGWEKNDTLKFEVPKMNANGVFAANLGLRINSSFPFMGLTLIVEQTIYPSHLTRSDTINCQLIDKTGKSKGLGISYYQYNFALSHVSLNKGDSLVVKVRHNMKREILPGISDIGYTLSTH